MGRDRSLFLPGIHTMQRPSRPFESLDWYREASRREYRSGNAVHKAIRWLKSSRCFAFHVGLFALGITIALAVNVARSPGTLWVDRLAVSWALVLLVHAAALALIFAFGLLGTSEQRLPVYVPQYGPAPDPVSEPASTETVWPAPPPRVESAPQEQPANQPQNQVRAAIRRPHIRPRPHVTNWPTASTAAEGGETSSWREASPAAWLKRKRTPSTPAATPDVSPSAVPEQQPDVE